MNSSRERFWECVFVLDKTYQGKRPERDPIGRCVACESRMSRLDAAKVACVSCRPLRIVAEPVRYTSSLEILADMLKAFRRITRHDRRTAIQFLRSLAREDTLKTEVDSPVSKPLD